MARNFVIRFILVLLVAASAGGCGTYVQRHLDQGDRYYKENKYREAIVEYEKARRISLDNARAHRQLGLSYFQLGEIAKAYQFLLKAESLLPADPDVRLKLAQVYLIGGRPGDAIREAEAILISNPQNTDAYSLLGTVYLANKDPAKAVDAYRRFVRVAPRNAMAHYLLGGSLIADRQVAEARTEFETALAISPNYLEPLTQLVSLDIWAKQLDSALARVDRSMRIAKRDAQRLVLLGSVHAARGNRDAAEAAYREAVRLDPNRPEGGLALAGFYLAGGETTQALAAADALLKAQPRSDAAHTLRGDILGSKGSYQEARQAYERALAINPRNAGAANNLAWLLSEKLGDKRRSYDLASIAYKEAPENPNVVDTFGWIVYKHGDYPRAVSLLKQSADRLADNGEVLYHYGMALLQTGDTVQARQVLSRAVRSPTHFDSLEAGHRVLLSLK
jgi:tetratricopeptide (TPR) repeat protein